MRVEFNLFASLKGYLPPKAKGNSCTVEISEGTEVRALLEQLKLPAHAVKLVFLKGVHARGDEILRDGDRVEVLFVD